tara:strand:+ start:271 stop:1302 length:1032 start_codon:yes stop_codon:yes gene_type:complete
MKISGQDALNKIINKINLSYEEMYFLFDEIMLGKISPELISAIAVGLRMKIETIDEIAAAAKVMREHSKKVKFLKSENLLDIVGTGGDNSNTFNISTASMFVVAAAGIPIAKHGGRSVSSNSGSADVLEELGININLTPDEVEESISTTGIGFMFAPNHHQAMKYAAPVRKKIGIRTIFNILGPLTNPANAPNILMGVFKSELVRIQIQVLQRLGTKRALVVCSNDNLDEISIETSTKVAELSEEKIKEYEIHPEEYNIQVYSNKNIKVNNVLESKQKIIESLQNVSGAARDIVILNSGAAIYIAGIKNSIHEGINYAKELISNGLAREKLEELKKFTNELKK